MFVRRAYRRHMPHYQSEFRSYFVTFVTAGRWVLPPLARTIALHRVIEEHGRRIGLHAVIVMPDHVHAVLTPTATSHGEAHPLPEILRLLKGSSARAINQALVRQGTVWHNESFDHELRHDESLRQKCEYVAQNPVRKGIVASPDDYTWLWREWIEGPE